MSFISTPRYGWDARVVMADPLMGYMFLANIGEYALLIDIDLLEVKCIIAL